MKKWNKSLKMIPHHIVYKRKHFAKGAIVLFWRLYLWLLLVHRVLRHIPWKGRFYSISKLLIYMKMRKISFLHIWIFLVSMHILRFYIYICLYMYSICICIVANTLWKFNIIFRAMFPIGRRNNGAQFSWKRSSASACFTDDKIKWLLL